MAFERRNNGGYAALYQNGRQMAPLAYHLARCTPDHPCAQRCIPQFHDVGIDVVGFLYYLHEDWTESGFDGRVLLQKIRQVKAVNPDAKLLVRCILTPPYWWMRKYPDELIKYYGVDSADTEHIAVVGNKDKTNEMRASFASQKWQADVCEMFKGMYHVLVEHGFGEDIFAMQPAYGTCGEWHMFGKYYDETTGIFEGDYSKPMLDYFRAYLRKTYKTNKALKKAWGNDSVTLKTAALATPSQRKSYKQIDGYLYRLPEYHKQALDSFICFHTAAPDAISCFAKCLKETWGNKILVGTFYGYYFACGDVFGRMLEPHKLFADENIDYLAAPSAYTANKMAGNAAFLRYAAESVRLNGKTFLCEIDQGYKSYCNYRALANGRKYVCADNAEYNAVTARNVFENVLRGMGVWFFDHQHPEDYGNLAGKVGYWDDPARMENIQKMRMAIEAIYARRPAFSPSGDVLIVYDTQSVYHQGPSSTGDGNDLHNTYNHFDMADALEKSGAACDTIWLYDLQKCDIARYKCVVFMACEAMRKSDYDYIRNVVMGGGRTVVFMRKNGFIVDGKTGLNNVTKLYGFTALAGGVQKENRRNCRVISAPDFIYDKAYYREVFREAGAHIYTDNGEVVVAQNNMVMVHTKGVQKTVLHLACGDVEIENGACNTAVFDNLTGERMY